MSNPLALLPLALAAGGGRVDDYEAQQLVAAGLTLLQRSVALVRALSGRRSAILLPTSPAFLTALAASEGRGAVLIDPLAAPLAIARQCDDANVGALFTTKALAAGAPGGLPIVILDDAPRTARVVANGVVKDVDLGSHHGLSLEGERDTAGRDEEAVIVYPADTGGTPLGAVLTHANLLTCAHSAMQALANVANDHVLALSPFANRDGLTVALIAPLLAGARVMTMDPFHPQRAIELLLAGVTEVVGVPAMFDAILRASTNRGADLRASSLRFAVCVDAAIPFELQDRWAEATGVELRRASTRLEQG